MFDPLHIVICFYSIDYSCFKMLEPVLLNMIHAPFIFMFNCTGSSYSWHQPLGALMVCMKIQGHGFLWGIVAGRPSLFCSVLFSLLLLIQVDLVLLKPLNGSPTLASHQSPHERKSFISLVITLCFSVFKQRKKHLKKSNKSSIKNIKHYTKT